MTVATVEELELGTDLWILRDEPVEGRADPLDVLKPYDDGALVLVDIESPQFLLDDLVEPVHLAVIDPVDTGEILEESLRLIGAVGREAGDIVIPEHPT